MRDFSTTVCDDGTICENFTPCVRHPIEEGSYICDCTTTQYPKWHKRQVHSSDDGHHDEVPKYAGVSCEHVVTSYCERGSETSAHAFCANGGKCVAMVGRGEEHAGCECPASYAGDRCQLVEGSPDNSTLPAPSRGWAGARDVPGAEVDVIIILTVAAAVFVLAAILVEVWRGNTEAEAADPRRAGFAGDESVRLGRLPKGQLVTVDMLEADGGVLTKALEARNNATGKGAAGRYLYEV